MAIMWMWQWVVGLAFRESMSTIFCVYHFISVADKNFTSLYGVKLGNSFMSIN